MVYHGSYGQGLNFVSDVLAGAGSFLAAHPSETILMRVKREREPSDGFDSAVKAALDKNARVYRGTSDNPLVREIRGKIVVLQDFTSSTRLGIPWSGFAIQDKYGLRSMTELADKWRAIKAQLDAAETGPTSTRYVNFLSGSSLGAGFVYPYSVASGRVDPATGARHMNTGFKRGVVDTCRNDPQRCIPEFPDQKCYQGACEVVFEGTNILTTNVIVARPGARRYGVIVADFPGRGLVKAVITSNVFRNVIRGRSSGRCVDVPGASQTDFTQVQLYDCHGRSNQSWTRTTAGELRAYGTKCLDALYSGTAEGTVVQLYTCNGTGAQKWWFYGDGTIVSSLSGRCLTSAGRAGSNGSSASCPPAPAGWTSAGTRVRRLSSRGGGR